MLPPSLILLMSLLRSLLAATSPGSIFIHLSYANFNLRSFLLLRYSNILQICFTSSHNSFRLRPCSFFICFNCLSGQIFRGKYLRFKVNEISHISFVMSSGVFKLWCENCICLILFLLKNRFRLLIV